MTKDPQGPSGSGQLGEIPYLRLPSPAALFSRRAERLAALSAGHTLSEYLEFLGRLAKVQLTAWETVYAARTSRAAPAAPAPRGDAPPVIGDDWREALRVIRTELSTRRAVPDEARAALERLGAAPRDKLETLAGRVLANATEGTDIAVGPFVAAALQVDLSDRASRADASSVARADAGCPVCGSLPMVGVVLAEDRLRYLVCSMCATQWHHTRLECTACRGTKDLAYFQLAGDRAASIPSASAAKAEACASCKAYTKLLYLEKDPRIEPLADDVATLALDLLMAEEGWARHGVNLFLIPGGDAGSGEPA